MPKRVLENMERPAELFDERIPIISTENWRYAIQ
jgi:hypothetical protein